MGRTANLEDITMITVRVFDPAQCCSSGVCGPSVDPELARFAADLAWLQARGVSVERFNLAQQPAAFVADGVVKSELEAKGTAALPVVKVNGDLRSTGVYPSRTELAAWVGIAGTENSNLAEPEFGANEGSCCGRAQAEPSAPKAGCC
jgi:hypothetical protein